MNTAIETLEQLITLRDTINLGIEVISHGVTGEYPVTGDDITQIVDDINTAWLDFDLNMAPESSIDASAILRMLGLDPVAESVPDKTRLAFTIIDGGLA